MELLDAPFRELSVYKKVKEFEKKGQNRLLFTGCTESGKLQMLHAFGADFDVNVIVTWKEQRAAELAEEYAMYRKNTFYFPAKDLIFFQADIYSNEITTARMKVLRALSEREPITIVTTPNALMVPLIPLNVLKESILTLQIKHLAEEKAMQILLTQMGYKKVPKVEEPGQFAVRGGIVDIFDLTQENPVRMELWGDEVESLRYFDVQTQRSLAQIKEVRIFPASEFLLKPPVRADGFEKIAAEVKTTVEAFREKAMNQQAHTLEKEWATLKEQVEEFSEIGALEGYLRYFYPEADTLSDYLKERKPLYLWDEPHKTDQFANAVEEEFKDSYFTRIEKGYTIPGQAKFLLPYEEMLKKLHSETVYGVTIHDGASCAIPFMQRVEMDTKPVAAYNGSVEELRKDMARYKKKGYRVLVVSSSKTRATRLADNLTEDGITAFFSNKRDRILKPGEVMTFCGLVRQGYEYPEIKFVVLSDTDIFGRERRKKRAKNFSGKVIRDFKELKVGDYVVHEHYGVGIYRGIVKDKKDGVTKDFMKIEYAQNSALYVLAGCFDAVMKYSSKDGKEPKLNAIGSPAWEKTKSKVQEAVMHTAKELVELYAARRRLPGHSFSPDTVWQKEFEELFPYEETDDQLQAIEATKADMESPRIMERLICGDVGYGKTEIAIRAAFKAVMDGYQVLVLTPTTILAEQHFNTFSARMKDYPVHVELLSRFRTPAEQRETVKKLNNGLVDIVIGTHRLLSKDIKPKNLGLLVIDEEQRFGVAHKEKLKEMKNVVDVLTLTATPIPRTLNMSLIGIRDISVLEEAPQNRLPIQTFIMEYNEEMVREAITRELNRGGQVYYVHNRINDITNVTKEVSALVPQAKVAFAHGQMPERELEDIMFDFINGEIDVLISTTIIETGLDIPNVNTIIIDRADRFGLAQLYQLRGRVGRSNRAAYAFMMYSKDSILTDQAEKRLEAIREFTELGSGFKISMRDLEIRGAGNILGYTQHGHMAAVGFELYCKMLNDAVLKEKGEMEDTGEISTEVDIAINAYLPSEYVVNELQKLEMYHKIAAIEGKVDYDEFRDELTDRFGPLPKPALNLLQVALLRARAKAVYITKIKGEKGKITFTVSKDAPFVSERIPKFINSFGGKLRFLRGSEPGFEYTLEVAGVSEIDENRQLEAVQMFTDRLRELL